MPLGKKIISTFTSCLDSILNFQHQIDEPWALLEINNLSESLLPSRISAQPKTKHFYLFWYDTEACNRHYNFLDRRDLSGTMYQILMVSLVYVWIFHCRLFFHYYLSIHIGNWYHSLQHCSFLWIKRLGLKNWSRIQASYH